MNVSEPVLVKKPVFILTIKSIKNKGGGGFCSVTGPLKRELSLKITDTSGRSQFTPKGGWTVP